MLPKHNKNGTCTNCGKGSFTLALDLTEYRACEWDSDSGTFVAVQCSEQPSQAEEAVRFFCDLCGTRHSVPEELV